MRTFIENYLHFMKNCIRPHYEKLKPLKSGFIENSILENNRHPCITININIAIIIMKPAIVQTRQSMEDDRNNNLQNNEDSPWTLISAAPICKIV